MTCAAVSPHLTTKIVAISVHIKEFSRMGMMMPGNFIYEIVNDCEKE